MDYLVVLLMLISCFSRALYVSGASCDNRWIAYEGSCYWFSESSVHFTEAEEYCRQRNSHLIHINNEAENNFIKDILRTMKHHYWWLGLTDEISEGQWRWFDTNELASFTDWSPGQPNTASEDCAIFCDCHDFRWDDIYCTRNCNPLCEKSSVENPGGVVG